MSVKAIAWAREQACSGRSSAKAALLLIADYADRDNRAWPSVSTLALELNMSERTVKRCLASLVADGHLTREARFRSNGKQTSSIYTLNVGRFAPLEGCHPDTPRGDNLTPLGVTGCHPEGVTLSPLTTLEPPTRTVERSDDLSSARGIAPDPFDEVLKRWGELAPDRIAPPVDRSAWDKQLAFVDEAELGAIALHFLATSDDVKRGRAPRLAIWLSEQRWRGYQLAAAKSATPIAAGAAWDGPPAIPAMIRERKGEAYLGSWLAGARWDVERRALLTRTGVAADTLKADLGAALAALGVERIEKGPA